MRLPRPLKEWSAKTFPKPEIIYRFYSKSIFSIFEKILHYMKEIEKHIEGVRKLCSSSKVKSLFAFGSAVREKLRPDSDLDFIVDIDDQDPLSYSDNYFNLKFNLEKIFNRKINLLEFRALKNQFLKREIERTRFRIYGE